MLQYSAELNAVVLSKLCLELEWGIYLNHYNVGGKAAKYIRWLWPVAALYLFSKWLPLTGKEIFVIQIEVK